MRSSLSLSLGIAIIVFLSLSLTTIANTQPVLAQIALSQTYTNSQCGISIKYPSDWLKEELNEKFGEDTGAPLTTLANFQPDTAEGYKSIVETEAWDISGFPDKSIDGIAESEREYILLDPAASIEEEKRIESISGLPAYRTVYTQPIPDSEEIWKIIQTYIVSADMEYVIRFTATDNESYDKYISSADNIAKSVIVDNNKKC